MERESVMGLHVYSAPVSRTCMFDTYRHSHLLHIVVSSSCEIVLVTQPVDKYYSYCSLVIFC